ncbi:MAG: hypothetical protein K6E54_04755 [Bacteroidaceae bacterium]|nr:hypothetical protein [Bacteroidaceae bacterium]
MKKISTLLSILLFSIVGLVMTSCEDEEVNGVTISGRWEGDMKMEMKATSPQLEQEATLVAKYTKIYFQSSENAFAESGLGKQIDYYDYGPYKQYYREFHWSINKSVNTNTVTITYDDNGEKIYLYNPGISKTNLSFYLNSSDEAENALCYFKADTNFDWSLEYTSIERANWEDAYLKYLESIKVEQ